MGDFNPNKSLNVWSSRYGRGLQGLGANYQRAIGSHPADNLLPEFTTPLFAQIGQQQQQAGQALRDNYGSALGSNQSGMQGRELASLQQSAPYGSATLAAKQQGFNRLQQLGTNLQNLKALESSWRSARVGEAQAKKSLNNQIALAGASAGGASGGSGGGLLDSILPLIAGIAGI